MQLSRGPSRSLLSFKKKSRSIRIRNSLQIKSASCMPTCMDFAARKYAHGFFGRKLRVILVSSILLGAYHARMCTFYQPSRCVRPTIAQHTGVRRLKRLFFRFRPWPVTTSSPLQSTSSMLPQVASLIRCYPSNIFSTS
jgi:hypothetical protein